MRELTKRQSEIYDYIKHVVQIKGYPPSVREIGEAVGLASSSTVHGHLSRLEEKGYIRRDPTKPRAIEIVSDQNNDMTREETIYVPVIGKVTAGVPITAVENIEEYFPLPEHLTSTHNSDVFILNVIGESMIEAGILDGDKVIVRSQTIAENGDIIVAMTEDDEATVKRFFKEKNRYRLQPENSAMSPIYLDNVTVIGKVIGLYREL
ncbi:MULTISPECIES: transcriptional repressor LexA [Staphylococcus]|jgi:repressor LexA|uniref:LexA repressor n=1 Tax=Staphylococcus hominis TaxID=1290 RepID=A0A4V2KWW8_STAHO|nr:MULTISPECIES: transcriptional repressor LexA [Staphylococcus]EUZ70290.1 LexA repressor [Staphylococcus sp. M0480]OFK82916.1 repressor LexA [Staphylococcus sp. HMSC057A02]OFM57365.1 repressor LexA [Staphylococcus sp. HMSC059G05]OFM63734.1 repressor LexA [Staphylococcus sp. HMSC062C01]OFM64119.1 repressor LexA [Staphylococcus sp. HMSC068D07]OFM75475.1 repressor LexA [Staphylococcus sp. HMSC074B09]OFM94926.1 repressor LexA [Staphylococcus sp. HMSC078D05]OFN13678.1 repressor LexA [Staphyloco